MTRVLVTGATGFVGRGLVPRLMRDGYEIRAATRGPADLSIESIVVGSIGPETEWSRALDGVDLVVHLAAHVHVAGDRSGATLEPFRRVNTHDWYIDA